MIYFHEASPDNTASHAKEETNSYLLLSSKIRIVQERQGQNHIVQESENPPTPPKEGLAGCSSHTGEHCVERRYSGINPSSFAAVYHAASESLISRIALVV